MLQCGVIELICFRQVVALRALLKLSPALHAVTCIKVAYECMCPPVLESTRILLQISLGTFVVAICCSRVAFVQARAASSVASHPTYHCYYILATMNGAS